MSAAQWRVEAISLTEDAKRDGRRAHYKFHISGKNLASDGASFSWTVPDVDGRFDLRGVEISREVSAVLPSECGICRNWHGDEVIHACE